MRRVLVCLLLAGVVCCAGALTTTLSAPKNTGFLYAFQNPHTRLQAMIANGDGEAYAQLARHPMMNPSDYNGPEGNWAEYRLSRPLWGWLGLLLGGSDWSFFFLEWLGIAFLAYMLTRRSYWGLVALLLPGVLSAAKTLTPEPFGMALALTGWFPLIGLVRETYLLFPLAAFLKTREKKYLVPFGLWGIWQAVVYLRGARGEPPGLLSAPLQGFLHSVPHFTTQDWFSLGLLVVLGVIAFRRYPVEAFLFSSLALCIRADSWARYLDLGRVMLPLEILGVVVITDRLRRRSISRDVIVAPPLGAGYG